MSSSGKGCGQVPYEEALGLLARGEGRKIQVMPSLESAAVAEDPAPA